MIGIFSYYDRQARYDTEEKKYKLTTAESCTGGMIASELVNVAGISEFYEEGYITYANHAKSKLLGVDEEVLKGL